MVDSEADAPNVVAVVVTHDPGTWFGDTLRALAAQDHPRFSVVVVDTGSDDPTERVHEVLPDAVVLRCDRDDGFGHAANAALELGSDPDHLVFCHDDVAPDPTAVSALLAAAIEEDAAVVGPKLVAWDEPKRLMQTGLLVDRVANPVALVEPGDLDQGQHDERREVFAVPGAFTLVRAELFARIGGFDEAISFLADDISLCWRARLAGARVLVEPRARVRHRQGLLERIPDQERRRLQVRHRLRVVLTCYGLGRLLRLLPRLLFVTGLDVLRGVVTVHPTRVRVALSAWRWNLTHARSVWVARRQVRRFRSVSDRVIGRAQLTGVGRTRVTRSRHGDARPSSWAGDPRGWSESLRSTWTGGAAVVAVLLVSLLVIGSRHLLTRGMPAVGEMLAFGAPRDLLGAWADGVRLGGGWRDTTPPTLLAALGGLGALLATPSTDILHTALTVGLIPLGVLGAFRILRPAASIRAAVGGAVAYAVVPVPYAALSRGQWGTLAVYAAAPWLLRELGRATGTAPFAGSSVAWSSLRLGLVTALLALLVPEAPLLLVGLAVTLALGSLVAIEPRGAGRLVGSAVGGAVVAFGLHMPWSVDILRSLRTASTAELVVGSWPGMQVGSDRLGFAEVVGLGGNLTSSNVSWGLAAAALVALLIGRGWRLAWAVRAWVVVLASWASIWGLQHYGVDGPVVAPDVLLVLAGSALALAVGLGVAAVERDVARRRGPGLLRPVVVLGGLVGLVVAALPVAQEAVRGDWGTPRDDFSALLASIDTGTETGPRVLWVGNPRALPGNAWSLPNTTDGGSRLGYLTTEGTPTAGDLLPGPPDPQTAALGDAVEQALGQQTARLGARLAAAGVRYVVAPQRLAPSPIDAPEVPGTPELLAALGSQLDLERVDVDPALAVYRNQAIPPVALTFVATWPGSTWRPDTLPAATTDGTVSATEPAESPSFRRALLVLQVVLWLSALLALARRRFRGLDPMRRVRAGITRGAEEPVEAVRLIMPETPRADVADILRPGRGGDWDDPADGFDDADELAPAGAAGDREAPAAPDARRPVVVAGPPGGS